MKKTALTWLETLSAAAEQLRNSQEIKGHADVQLALNKLDGQLDAVRKVVIGKLPQAQRRVLILPSDPNDKSTFAIEAMADAMGLRIAEALIEEEEPKSTPTVHPASEAAVLSSSGWMGSSTEQRASSEPRPTPAIPAAPAKTDDQLVSEHLQTVGVTKIPDGAKAPVISKKTGKPKRGYVKGGRPGTFYAKQKLRLS